MAATTYKVKQVAQVSGVTVRTLHHYDAIGLLSPKTRTDAGYRIYTSADLLLLQQILVYRELGLSLDKINRLINDPAFDRRAALVEQRAQLRKRADHVNTMIKAVDAALLNQEEDPIMDTQELFDGFDPSKYEAEAEKRWGHTDAYAECAARTRRYDDADWLEIKAQNAALLGRVATLSAANVSPTSQAAMDLAEEHRQQIDRWYYPCDHAAHAALSELYVGESAFQISLDKHGRGVAAFLAAAIQANSGEGGRG